MNKADTRVELRKASNALLDARHADQDQAHRHCDFGSTWDVDLLGDEG
jgi:hypothetical protein